VAERRTITLLAMDSETGSLLKPSNTSDNITISSTNIDESQRSSVPWPGRTFIIRSHTNKKVITFLNGEVILDKLGGLSTYRWRCVVRNGWIGFQDPASARYLGYNKEGWFRCEVNEHNDWEYLCPRKNPEGEYLILVLVNGRLLPLRSDPDVKEEDVKQTVRIGDWNSEGVVWDFIEVSN
jgi:hypothetical protein